MQEHFYVPEPRDPITGRFFDPGPIRLSELQCRLIDEALSTTIHPEWQVPVFKYTNILYSTRKKSGKSTLASGAGLYVIYHTPYSRGFCLANDGEQSNDILFGPIYTCMQLHNQLGGIFKGIRANLDGVILKNGSRLEPLPCDAVGNAGKEPTITLWSELHGFETEVKRKLWAEMTVPPTKFGRAVRWVETYAGYQGVSKLLWELYQLGLTGGEPHPDFLDITSNGDPVVKVNEDAGLFWYWDHEPRMIWQQGEEGRKYYVQEAKNLPPAEFRRLHGNEWVSPMGSFVQPSQWDDCDDPTLPEDMDARTPIVVALDAAETNDCAAMVAVYRHPLRPATDVAILAAKIFKPGGPTGTILLEDTLGRTLLDWGMRWNITVIAYDAYQLAKMVQDYRRGNLTLSEQDLVRIMEQYVGTGVTMEEALARYRKAIQRWYYKYSQQNQRTVADKQLYDMIVHRQLHYNGKALNWDIGARGDAETLTKHIKQAGASQGKGQYRLVKLSNELKIDGAVALSMATELCLRLNLGGGEVTAMSLVTKLEGGEISLETFEQTMAMLRAEGGGE